MNSRRNYKLRNYLGHGSFGRVYCVENTEGNILAMKEINWSTLDEKEKRNLVSEISLQKCNNSPYIIQYYESYIEDGNIYIISQYAEKGDMHTYRAKHPNKITDAFVAKTLIHIASGLAYLHRNNIVHRDIKPHNILITKDGNAVIADLGIAKFFPDSNLLNSLTGSPVCMSPEMCAGTGYNEKTDIWSLGCVVYYLLKGTYPYNAENILQLYYRIVNHTYEPITIDDTIFYKEWNAIIEKLLDKNPFTRYRASVICQESFLLTFIKSSIEDIQKKLHATNSIGENIWELHNAFLAKKEDYTEEELADIIQRIDKYKPRRTIELVDTMQVVDTQHTVDTPPAIPKLRLSPIISSLTSSPSSTPNITRRTSLPPLVLPPIETTPRIETYRRRGSVYYGYRVNSDSSRSKCQYSPHKEEYKTE